MEYVFILGNHPYLSLAELLFVEPATLLDHSVRRAGSRPSFVESQSPILVFDQNVAIVEYQQDIDVKSLQERLGGSVKIGKILEKIPYTVFSKSIFMDALIKALPSTGRITFGFSFYLLNSRTSLSLGHASPKASLGREVETELRVGHVEIQNLKNIGMELKKELGNRGISSRLVRAKDGDNNPSNMTLSSVTVTKNHLLPPSGIEFLIVFERDGLFLGKTLTVQPFESYSKRDYGRPKRNAKQGMLPPKLSRIMLNLAGINTEKSVFFDPFCGSGTILQEALLLGIKKVIGSDFSQNAVAATRENLSWLCSQLPSLTENKGCLFEVFQCDARKISHHLNKNSVDAIVTEPYLGPALTRNESLNTLERIAKKLTVLYAACAKEFNVILRKQGRLVMVIPHFLFEKQKISPHIAWERYGFRKMIPLPPSFHISSLTYHRPDQRLIREIVILEKVNELEPKND
jgi:tRNA G10  N-methylase Trm11